MRYVRLKNQPKIITYDENADDLDKPMILHYPSEIVKESADIEDLFDGDVKIKDGEVVKVHLKAEGFPPNQYGSHVEDGAEIKAFITSSKGLIFVATHIEGNEWRLL